MKRQKSAVLVEELFDAVKEGNLDSIRDLLEQGAEVEAVNHESDNLLHVASRFGFKDVAEFLLTKGLKINATDQNGLTALHLASKNGHVGVAQLLIDNNADLLTRSNSGQMAIHIATEYGHIDVIQLLLNSGQVDDDDEDEDSCNPLHVASKHGNLHVAQFFVDKPNYAYYLRGEAYDFRMPIHVAAEYGHKDMIAIFLNKGQNVDEVTQEERYTPLHVASKHGQLDVAEFLINNNANVHAESHFDGKPIHIASEYGHKHIIKLLLSKGVKIDETRNNDVTPLHVSSENGRIEVTQFLIDNNANMYATTYYGQKPIHYAAEAGHEAVIEIFLKAGLDIDEIDWEKKTSLHIASELGHPNLVQYLLDNNANIHAKCSMNREPIHLGVCFRCGGIDVAKLLLDKGANVNETDEENLTPLHIASQSSNFEMVKFLINQGANIHAKCFMNQKPVFHAVESGNLEIVEFYLSHGVGVDDTDINGLTILHFAVMNKHLNIVEFLSTRHKVNIDVQNNKGYTALHLSSKYYCPGIMKYLLEEGAKSDIRDNYQRTALFYYLDIWRPTDPFTSEILEKIYNYIDIDNMEQKTAVHILVNRQFGFECLQFVLQYQKDLNVEDVYGKTPLTYITEDQHYITNDEWRKKLIRLLISNGAFFNANDGQRIIANPSLKELLTDLNLCTQSIINKFNNRDLPLLHSLPLSIQLPSCDRMKASSNQVRMIELAIEEEIRNEGHCDISKVPLSLAMLSVDAFISRYSELGQLLRILARLN